MSAATTTGPRTYGNWRKPSSPGLPRLGLLGTIAALTGLVITLLTAMSVGLIPAGVVAVVIIIALAPLVWRNRAGRNGWQVMTANLLWSIGRRRKQHVHLAGLASPVAFGETRLPGLLADTELLAAQNSYGEQFGLLHIKASNQFSIVIRCHPDGAELVDADTLDTRVAEHGAFLSNLAHEPGLAAISTTVETAPDPGSHLSAEVKTLLRDDAPSLARDVLQEAASTYPKGAASVTGWVTLTFSAMRPRTTEREAFGRRRRQRNTTPEPPRLRTPDEMATIIGQRLPGLLNQLRATGAGTGRALSPGEVTELVRSAYDPEAAKGISDSRAAGINPDFAWHSAGPMGQMEMWDHLRHDGSASITWQMIKPPQAAVQSTVLQRLLGADETVDRKRVTIIYRPHDPGTAATIAHADVRTAMGMTGDGRGEIRAADTLNVVATRQSSNEVAQGAGLTRFSLLVTATVTDPKRLPAAAEVVTQLGSASQINLRRCFGTQSASFAAALGIGVILPNHVAVPDMVRDNI